jgi:THO complex subunit 2
MNENEVKDTDMTDSVPMGTALIDASVPGTKMEDTEKSKDSGAKAEVTAEATSTSAQDHQDSRISGSSTPSARMNSGDKRQQDDGSKTSNQLSRGNPQRPDTVSSPLQPHPNLPHRPERPEPRHVRPSDARIPNRPPTHAESPRDQRNARAHDLAPSSRYSDNHQEAADHSRGSRPHERRSERIDSGRERVDKPRSQEREAGPRYPPQDRRNQPQSHENGWEADSAGRPRPPPDSPRHRIEQDRAQQERPLHEHHMAPPRGPQSASAEATNINPERAALISGGLGNRDGISIRGQGEDRPARGSRPTSPKGEYDSRHPPRQERPSDRPEPVDRRSGDFESRPRDRREAPFGSGHRTQYPERPPRSGDGFPRDLRHQPPQQYPQVDMNHGRLNNDDRPPSRHHESSDRPEPTNDVPSGPRARNPPSTSRGRNAHPQQAQAAPQRSSSNNIQSSMGAPDRPAPTGPASHSHTRASSFQEQQIITSPTTPADTSGVHPDRIALVSPSAEGPSQRLPSFQPKPPPLQTPSASVPSGPRGNAPSGAPSGPAPSNRAPPSGPQGNNRNNRHPLAAVNNTLQQAGQGQSIRGRGGNRSMNGPPMTHSDPSTPIAGLNQGPRSEVTIPSSQDHGRPDLFSNREDRNMNGRPPPIPPDRPPPSGRRGDLIGEANESGKRSSRHSGGSRTDSPDADSSGRRTERGQGGHRDRDTYRSERDSEVRERGHDRENEGGYDRRSGDVPDRPLRETSSRQRDDPPQPPLGPQRRSTRRHVSSAEAPPNNNPPPQGPSQGPSHDDRGRRRGYQSGPSRGDDRDQRGGDREMRERAGPPRDLRGPPRDSGDLPPRKHPRADESAPYSGGGGRGGNRMASESKRPRRGG